METMLTGMGTWYLLSCCSSLSLILIVTTLNLTEHCSVAEELLDEDNHFVLLDGSGVVLVEGGEDLIESLVGELVTGSEVTEGVLNELLGLLFVEGAALVN